MMLQEILYVVLFGFGGTVVWTQGFMLGR
jgi:hypothetical protein